MTPMEVFDVTTIREISLGVFKFKVTNAMLVYGIFGGLLLWVYFIGLGSRRMVPGTIQVVRDIILETI